MSTSLQSATPDSRPRRGLPRWAWVVIGLLTVIAIVAAATAFAVRGRQVIVLPPGPAEPASRATSTPTPSALPQAVTLADGCLGGATDLDRAVLTAQGDAPLTPAGAASFSATLVRWVYAAPPPPFQKVTAQQVLTGDATSAVRQSLSSAKDLQGSTVSIDFTDGRYYVESFDGRSAIVSYVASAASTQDGAPLGRAIIGGSAHLEAVNGTWRYRDRSAERTIADIQRIGSPYAGGC